MNSTILNQIVEYWSLGGLLMVPIFIVCTLFWLKYFKLRYQMKDDLNRGICPDYSAEFFVVNALVSVAPLLGLLGTVSGMITTFNSISQSGANLVDGISQALITTQVGLAVAIPGAFAVAHLNSTYRKINHAINHSESLVTVNLKSSEESDEKAY